MTLQAEAAIMAAIQAQAADVLPALEGTYAGAAAGGVAAILGMVLQDLMTRPQRTAAELERLQALLPEAGSDLDALRGELAPAWTDANEDRRRAILDHLVATTAAEKLAAPEM